MSIYFRPDNTAYVADTHSVPKSNPTGLLGDDVTSVGSEPHHVHACQTLTMSLPTEPVEERPLHFVSKPLRESVASITKRLATMGRQYYSDLLSPEQWSALKDLRSELSRLSPTDRSKNQRAMLLGMDCLSYARDSGSCLEGAKMMGLNPNLFEEQILKLLDTMFNIKLVQLCDPTHEAEDERDETNPISRILTRRQWTLIHERKRDLERIQVKSLEDVQLHDAINNLLCVKECGSYHLAASQLGTSKYHLALSITTYIFNGMFDLRMPNPKE